jgi:hypothetical protein
MEGYSHILTLSHCQENGNYGEVPRRAPLIGKILFIQIFMDSVQIRIRPEVEFDPILFMKKIGAAIRD